MTDEQRLSLQREVSDGAQVLGRWLESAAAETVAVPVETWRQIAEAAARVAAAATMLAKEPVPRSG